ncbi:MAG: phage head closure protein [Phyllobacterium sp.]
MPALFIDPGSLSQALFLEAPLTIQDETGALETTWTEIARLWARVEPAGPGRRLFGEQALAEVTHVVTLRGRRDIAGDMRFRKGLRIFPILAMHDPDDTGRYLVCRVREEVR